MRQASKRIPESAEKTLEFIIAIRSLRLTALVSF